jgi:putative endonuclease
VYYVYVLRSDKSPRRYIGCTADRDRRLLEHNTRHTPSTRSGVPWRIVYSEACPTRTLAAKRERQLKAGQGRAFLDRLGC